MNLAGRCWGPIKRGANTSQTNYSPALRRLISETAEIILDAALHDPEVDGKKDAHFRASTFLKSQLED